MRAVGGSRIRPAGPWRFIALPAISIAPCVFAGDGVDRLLVTRSGSGADGGALFEVDAGVVGGPTYRFGG